MCEYVHMHVGAMEAKGVVFLYIWNDRQLLASPCGN